MGAAQDAHDNGIGLLSTTTSLDGGRGCGRPQGRPWLWEDAGAAEGETGWSDTQPPYDARTCDRESAGPTDAMKSCRPEGCEPCVVVVGRACCLVILLHAEIHRYRHLAHTLSISRNSYIATAKPITLTRAVLRELSHFRSSPGRACRHSCPCLAHQPSFALSCFNSEHHDDDPCVASTSDVPHEATGSTVVSTTTPSARGIQHRSVSEASITACVRQGHRVGISQACSPRFGTQRARDNLCAESESLGGIA